MGQLIPFSTKFKIKVCVCVCVWGGGGGGGVHLKPVFPSLKVGVKVNLSEILRGLKKGERKENYFSNTTRQLTPTQEHPRLSGGCFGVSIYQFLTSNSNFKITFNLKYFVFLQILLIL